MHCHCTLSLCTVLLHCHYVLSVCTAIVYCHCTLPLCTVILHCCCVLALYPAVVHCHCTLPLCTVIMLSVIVYWYCEMCSFSTICSVNCPLALFTSQNLANFLFPLRRRRLNTCCQQPSCRPRLPSLWANSRTLRLKSRGPARPLTCKWTKREYRATRPQQAFTNTQ